MGRDDVLHVPEELVWDSSVWDTEGNTLDLPIRDLRFRSAAASWTMKEMASWWKLSRCSWLFCFVRQKVFGKKVSKHLLVTEVVS